MDGLWTGAIPQSQSELDLQTGKPTDPKWLGDESASVLGSNTVPLWEDPAKTLSIGSFTTFVFVAINDQTVPGRCAPHGGGPCAPLASKNFSRSK